MGESKTSSSIWEEIEQSESYLLCSSYEEAASLASSFLTRIRKHNEDVSNEVLGDLMESAGMVFVQSMKGLGRTAEILNELKLLFVSVEDIPVQVLLTGACFQIAEGAYIGVREFLEEFLTKWSFVDGQYHVALGAKRNVDSVEEREGRFVLEIDEYLDVVELYAVTLLGKVMNNVDIATSWIEKASLPEEKRQDLLRRLHSLYSLKVASTSQGSSVPPADLSSLEQLNSSEGSLNASNRSYTPREEKVPKQAIMNIPKQPYTFLLWFHPITLKLGGTKIVLTNGKVILGCLILFAYYILRRRRATLMSSVWRRILSMKNALVDLWQLAFSYQVNPLAAVQPLPATTRQGR